VFGFAGIGGSDMEELCHLLVGFVTTDTKLMNDFTVLTLPAHKNGLLV